MLKYVRRAISSHPFLPLYKPTKTAASTKVGDIGPQPKRLDLQPDIFSGIPASWTPPPFSFGSRERFVA